MPNTQIYTSERAGSAANWAEPPIGRGRAKIARVFEADIEGLAKPHAPDGRSANRRHWRNRPLLFIWIKGWNRFGLRSWFLARFVAGIWLATGRRHRRFVFASRFLLRYPDRGQFSKQTSYEFLHRSLSRGKPKGNHVFTIAMKPYGREMSSDNAADLHLVFELVAVRIWRVSRALQSGVLRYRPDFVDGKSTLGQCDKGC
ncbi:hypothetical protein N181_24165 [Sinorhizobium fredii USDA 205]|uniref:Uncharacterized protein n=1 Tax=Rhizobium fredii TaxID=380 RepID=A0A844AGJ1_RHIFR|nr:hypothetical protein [Sinorhizobium fredii]KSV84482.1 hypothetical protein N181_24165 [Sinorhizobium fredii USDA 205]MQX12073.1 hypothetical protein [Sinorhizobium fredii]